MTFTKTGFSAGRLALAMAISGTVGAFATEAAVGPVTAVFWRCVFATAFLGLWCLSCGYLSASGVTIRNIATAVLSGIFIVLGWISFFQAMSLTSIGAATVLFHVHPFFLILMGASVFKERIDRDQSLWIVGAFIGVALMGFGNADPQGHETNGSMGVLLALLSAMFYALATLLAKRLGDLRPETTALCQTATGIVMLAPFFASFDPVTGASWGWLIGMGIIQTGIAYVLMYSSYPNLETSAIGVLAFVYPMVTLIIDRVVYDQHLSWMQATGIILILVGTFGVRMGWKVLRPG
ncbi:EamA family transporter [Martelella sp. HB161492]|uniref:DMT family transporter n=1 Tax=Martelella sp. HB161492 TaxID=2720726 RepID=UPI001590E253|nr:EamA family transporter [Martelella sp. HB161492]